MYAKDYHDLGTPAAKGESVTLEIDGATDHGARGYVDHACRGARGSRRAEALRHRHAQGLRLLPRVPGGDRRAQGISGLVHHRGCRRHEGAYAERGADEAAPRRARAVRLRTSHGQLAPTRAVASSRHLAEEHGIAESRYRRAEDRASCAHATSRSTPAIRISASTMTCASSVRAACAPARRPRALTR